jgi:hypothetical protein
MSDEHLRYPVGRFSPKDSYSMDEIHQHIARIAELPNDVRGITITLSMEQLATPYRPGGWTALQVIHHLADSHLNAFIRTKWALTENTPMIKAYDEKAWAETPETSLDAMLSLELLSALHLKWTALLRKLSPVELDKKFLHPETKKEVPLSRNIALYSWHGEHHCGHLKIVANMR